MRQCGDCQLCCRLLPVRPLAKGANETCRHQKFKKGCTVYRTPAMPLDCSLWNCRWLVNDDTADMSRPDRAHYVVDIMPDFVTVVENETGKKDHVEVVQIWIDPAYPDAHRDPALRAFLMRRAQEGKVAIVRFDTQKAITLVAPTMASGEQWLEIIDGTSEARTHSPLEIIEAISGKPFHQAGG